MRKYLIAAVAVAAASPAFAGPDGPYVGIEGGVSLPQSNTYNVTVSHGTTSTTYDDALGVHRKLGYDVDLVAGLKLGLLRLEAEGGYQRAKVNGLTVSNTLLSDVGTTAGTTVVPGDLNLGDHIGVKKLMANALIDGDFGGGFGGYAGVGAGRAWAKFSGDSDNAWAYQAIAGLHYAVSSNVDAGLKYEYFRTGNLNFHNAFAVNGANFTSNARGKFSSSNLLASLTYSFGGRAAPAPAPIPAAAPAPPPPAPVPATQTCPDGSVIDASASCPAAPPPPPPPPAQRGERG